MFYYLFLECEDEIELLQNKLECITQVDKKHISLEGNILTFLTNNFTLYIRKGGDSVRFRNEDYNLNFNYHFNFEVFPNTNWASELMRITGELIKLYLGNCLVESNGDRPILLRKGNSIVVDDSKLHGTVRFPFDSLGLDYVEGHIDDSNL